MKKFPKNFWLRDTSETVRTSDPAPTTKLRSDPLTQPVDGDAEHLDSFDKHERPAFGVLRHKFRLGEEHATDRQDRARYVEQEHLRDMRDERGAHDDEGDASPATASPVSIDPVSLDRFFVEISDAISSHKSPTEVAVGDRR